MDGARGILSKSRSFDSLRCATVAQDDSSYCFTYQVLASYLYADTAWIKRRSAALQTYKWKHREPYGKRAALQVARRAAKLRLQVDQDCEKRGVFLLKKWHFGPQKAVLGSQKGQNRGFAVTGK
jgi:hypothetical protein